MKRRTITTLTTACLCAAALPAQAADTFGGMFAGGKIGGQLREFTISRAYSDTRPAAGNDYTRWANALGGYVKYETAEAGGLSLGGAFYGTYGFLLHSDGADDRKVDPTLLGKDNGSYGFLGEAFLQYRHDKTRVKVGRQRLDTPLAGSDDYRMLPNLFEAGVVSYDGIENLTLVAAHVTRFAQGTFGRAFNAGAGGGNAVLSVTSGYSLTDSRDRAGRFVGMGEYAIGEDTGGVTFAGATYTGIEGLKLQAWDYYAHDILNAVYAEAVYAPAVSGGIAPYAGVQYIRQNDVGENRVIGKVNSEYQGAKIGVKAAGFDLYGALSRNGKDAKAAANGGTLSPWGGIPAYTQAMVTRHQFLAGTEVWKIAGTYNWKDHGLDLKTILHYSSSAMDRLNGYSADHAWTAKESGADFIYVPEEAKALQLRFRANHAEDFYENAAGSVGWDEYRLIVNYDL